MYDFLTMTAFFLGFAFIGLALVPFLLDRVTSAVLAVACFAFAGAVAMDRAARALDAIRARTAHRE